MIKSLLVAVTLIAVAGATRTVAQPTANPDATLPAGVGAPYRELMVPSQFPTLAAAVNAANADTDRSRGVVITIDPGTYTNDFTPMLTRPMTIRSAQGLGTVTLNSTVVQNANSNPGIITSHTDLTVDGLIFTGARNGSNNGAGIRDRRGVGAAPGFLAVQNSIFISNQMGILTGDGPVRVLVTHALFMNSTMSHLLYTNNVTAPSTLVVMDSDFCGAGGGRGRHAIQTRNRTTMIAHNRFWVGADASIPGCIRGDGNFAINIINGGPAIVADNVIVKGPGGVNANTVAYAVDFTATGGAHPTSTLIFQRNCMFNTRGSGTGIFTGISAPVIGDGNFFAPEFGTLVNPTASNQMTGTVRTEPANCATESPDGSQIDAPTTETLVNRDGRWGFANEQPEPGQFRITLNDQPNDGWGSNLRIAQGGQVFVRNSLRNNWWVWRNNTWVNVGPATP